MFLIEWLNEQMAILEKDREDHKAKFDAETICNEKWGSRREPKRGQEEQKKVESDDFLPEYLCCWKRKKEDDKIKVKTGNPNAIGICEDDSDATERGDGKAKKKEEPENVETDLNLCSSAAIFISSRQARLTRESIMSGKLTKKYSKEWDKKADKRKSEMPEWEKHTYFPKHDNKDIVNVLEYAMQLNLRKSTTDYRELLQFKFGNPAKTYHLVPNVKKVYE